MPSVLIVGYANRLRSDDGLGFRAPAVARADPAIVDGDSGFRALGPPEN